MAPNCPTSSSYTPWSTGDDSNRYSQQLLQGEPTSGDFWSSGSSDLETPAWDIEYSENGPGAWDYDLSTQLAAKLLMIDPTAGTQLPELESDVCIGTSLIGTAGLAALNPRFKTEFCRNYKEKGACMYGDLCQFAHGRHELRKDVIRHNKYKTKLCQKFWIVGYCAYGPRCNFVHNELEGDNQASGGSGGAANINGGGRFREYHVSYRKTSLGDSGGDSGSEQGSVTAAGLGVQLSPPHIFHPEDNPLPLGGTNTGRTAAAAAIPSRILNDQVTGNSGLGYRRAWDLPFF